MFAELRARAWQVAAILFAVLAVAAVLAWAFSRAGAAADSARADAAEARAERLAGKVSELEQAAKSDSVSAEGSNAARKSAESRQAKRDESMQRVEGYARDAGNTCVGSADILRELEEGAGGIRSAEDRLRGDGRATGQGAQPARTD